MGKVHTTVAFVLVMVGASAMCPVNSADSSVAVWRVATCPGTSFVQCLLSTFWPNNLIPANNNDAEPGWDSRKRRINSRSLATKVLRTEARIKHRNFAKLPRNRRIRRRDNHSSASQQQTPEGPCASLQCHLHGTTGALRLGCNPGYAAC